MLEPALLHKSILETKLASTWYDEKYKYYYAAGFHELPDIKEEDWNMIHFASVDKGQVIGYIAFTINRNSRNFSDVEILSFEPSAVFARDVLRAFDFAFNHYGAHKILFSAAVDNPASKVYDKYIEKIGGRAVGIKKQDWKLCDGKYYDVKIYEILADEYKNLTKS